MFFKRKTHRGSVPAPESTKPVVRTSFFAGTRIATSQGWCAVEDLVVGQLVHCADRRSHEIASVLHMPMHVTSGGQPVINWPLLLPENAVGNAAQLMVAPDLRLVIKTPSAKRDLQCRQYSIRAETLLGYRGITRAPLTGDVERVEIGFREASTLVLEGGLLLDVPSLSGEFGVPALDDRQSRSILHKLRRAEARRAH